ncbi:DUF998 domain-containing protein [Nocardia sp. NPDC005978]|uniref:DUF998 domain-containing protein n=1 Tax=Nocardia sp. NPDC005978 TaxID=3156725 RepID=UPI0033BD70B9
MANSGFELSGGLDRRARAGAIVWVLVVQYFVFLFVVQGGWDTPYSWVRNAISDLGAANCAASGERWVCSPWHLVANVSWVIAGACLVAGALMLAPTLPRNRLGRFGTGLAVATGAGLIVVGLNPEDTSARWHVIGAIVAIGGGIASLLCLSIAIGRTRDWPVIARFGVAIGAVAVAGLVLMVAGVGGPGQFGLWERVAAFPFLVWTILYGCDVLRVARRRSAAAAQSGAGA